MKYYVHHREHSSASETFIVVTALALFAWVFALLVNINALIDAYNPGSYSFDPVDVYVAAATFEAVFWVGLLVIGGLVLACFATRGRVVVTEHEGEPDRLMEGRAKATKRAGAPHKPDRRAPAIYN